ncbi:hypothetical protein [Nocardia concava]|uniref:hypothetical protein n=1 Tax=Nocardia concava TaxID=257281 RepID=UPI0003104B3E|nr:hypothetical protein [Nocardia concava]
MVTFDWRHDAPRTLDDPAWETFSANEFVVLVVARTLTSAYRLLEAVEWFRDDFRIRLVFTADATSAFSSGVLDLLGSSGVRLVDWEQVRARTFRYHLVLTASENIDFDALDAHAVLLPHGLGFNKLVPSGEGADRLAGLPPTRALRAGKVTVALSHPEQRDQLLTANPETAGHTAIVGDPTFDRLHASRALRHRYRESLGTGDRTLVAVASTWGKQSLIGRRPSLPAELLAAIDADSYQVVLVLHPNVWARYGKLQIELWLSSALAAGLILMPPESGWQAALIASDQVISDHGSLALFAAALDRPLLLAGRAPETVPGTPTDDLAKAVPTLLSGTDLRPQLESARQSHRPGSYAHITDRVFSHVGDATRNMRNLLYRELGATPPSHPNPLARIPIPQARARTVTSYVVQNAAATGPTLTLVRFPASVWRDPEDGEIETHVVADESEADPTILERAAAVTRDLPLNPSQAHRWAQSALSAYPGARLAITATPDGALAVLRGGGTVRVITESDPSANVQLLASAIYCCLIDRSLTDRLVTIQAGTTTLTAELILDPSPDAAPR